jgi:uncharacterized membrane protein YdjX (TVP38/TMEM64 family)
MKNKPYIRLLLFLPIIAGIVAVLLNRDLFDIDVIKASLDKLGIYAPVIFIGLYMIGTLFFLPGSLLTLAGGALFGPWLGTLYNLTGATLGATLAFMLSRYIGSEWVQQKASGILQKLLDGVEAEGWRFIAFVRLVPLFPFNLLNYALGLTRIKLIPYVLTSWVCMLPGGFAYTWLGHAGSEAASGNENTMQNVLIAIALLAILIYIPRVLKKLKSTNH